MFYGNFPVFIIRETIWNKQLKFYSQYVIFEVLPQFIHFAFAFNFLNNIEFILHLKH